MAGGEVGEASHLGPAGPDRREILFYVWLDDISERDLIHVLKRSL